MTKKIHNATKLSIGFASSLFFLYLAFRKVSYSQLLEALGNTNVGLLFLAIIVLFFSHWLRAVRHHYLLEPVKRIEIGSLFSALMIGYMLNTILPAHLGEFLRAYVLGKKERIAGSSVLASIVVERTVDVLSLLIIMGLAFLVYPFPEMIKLSAYLSLAVAAAIVALLALLKLRPEFMLRFIKIITQPFPRSLRNKLVTLVESFTQGIVALKDRETYVIFFILSVLIWIAYTAVLAIGLYAFDFIELYHVPLGASFVVLIMTTIGILIPSSPGYVGTYHWLCMLSLGLFGVPESPALAYAIAVHAISMIPVALVGVAFALKEGMKLSEIGRRVEVEQVAITD
jgi:uncharacterized protein (TIRG00374 family)